MLTGKVMDIKKFAVHDGDGIRTTVFFKGCSLKCVWCHNPEGISFKPQLSYIEKKCLSCGECLVVCPQGAHEINENGNHRFLREKCIGCGKCEPACLGEALLLYGKDYTVEELMPILLEDKSFYDNSGGGVTLSGGEALMQADFCRELLIALKDAGISTAVDTCGFVNREAFDKTAPYTDIYLYDMKAYDEDVHIRCTGHSNKTILENLLYIDSLGKKTEIRFPFVPQYNSGETEKIAAFLSKLKNLTKARVLAYHNFAGSKYDAVGMENTMPRVPLPTDEDIEAQNAIFERYGIETVKN